MFFFSLSRLRYPIKGDLVLAVNCVALHSGPNGWKWGKWSRPSTLRRSQVETWVNYSASVLFVQVANKGFDCWRAIYCVRISFVCVCMCAWPLREGPSLSKAPWEKCLISRLFPPEAEKNGKNIYLKETSRWLFSVSAKSSHGVFAYKKDQTTPLMHKCLWCKRLLTRNSALLSLWIADSRQCNVFFGLLFCLAFFFKFCRDTFHVFSLRVKAGRQAGWQLVAAAPVQRQVKGKGNTKLTFKPRQAATAATVAGIV